MTTDKSKTGSPASAAGGGCVDWEALDRVKLGGPQAKDTFTLYRNAEGDLVVRIPHRDKRWYTEMLFVPADWPDAVRVAD